MMLSTKYFPTFQQDDGCFLVPRYFDASLNLNQICFNLNLFNFEKKNEKGQVGVFQGFVKFYSKLFKDKKP